jgi:hypothetical protein
MMLPRSFVPTNGGDDEFVAAVTKLAAAPPAAPPRAAARAPAAAAPATPATVAAPARAAAPQKATSSALLDELGDIEASLKDAAPRARSERPERPESVPIPQEQDVPARPGSTPIPSSPNLTRRYAEAEARGVMLNPALKAKSSFNPLADVPLSRASSTTRAKSVNDGTEILLSWLQLQVSGCGVKISGFTSQSWGDGLAFCALAAARTGALNFEECKQLAPVERLRRAYAAFTQAGVNPLLDAEDLAAEKLSNMTYLSEIFKTLRR